MKATNVLLVLALFLAFSSSAAFAQDKVSAIKTPAKDMVPVKKELPKLDRALLTPDDPVDLPPSPIASFDILDVHMAANTSGEWFYGCVLKNTDQSNKLLGEHISIQAIERYINTTIPAVEHDPVELSFDIGPGKQRLFRETFKHLSSAHYLEFILVADNGEASNTYTTTIELQSYSQLVNLVNVQWNESQKALSFGVQNDSKYHIALHLSPLLYGKTSQLANPGTDIIAEPGKTTGGVVTLPYIDDESTSVTLKATEPNARTTFGAYPIIYKKITIR